MTSIIICPVCGTPLAYTDRLSGHLMTQHKKQIISSMDALDTYPIFGLIIDANGVIWQKQNNNEFCWYRIKLNEPISSFSLRHTITQPIMGMGGDD